jgi:GH15 family glucan-1,4-alpha-glucosidase
VTAVPALAGVLSAGQCRQTAAAIAAVQQPSGAIPWFPGGHTDPWDHVQNAMALSAAGRLDDAVRAYEWLRAVQRADGTWAAKDVGADSEPVEDAGSEANFCAYVATGVWHHWSVTRDRSFVERMWPVVRDAINSVTDLQAPGGEIWMGRDSAGRVDQLALVTGNASMHLSLRCAVALAELRGDLAPDWELAAAGVRHALSEHPERFADKSRYSMDWYYPVLGGALPASAAHQRLDAGWADFVVRGLGIRCVSDAPWVTGAETCELVMALDAAGRGDQAHTQLAAMQHLRDDDGSYWTGLVFTDGKRWPVERTTWTAATVILAVDALSRTTGGSGLFRGEGLAPVPTEEVCTCPATR